MYVTIHEHKSRAFERREYLDLRGRKKEEAGEKLHNVWSFIICTLLQILLG
jgi:hypothetical protein